MARRLAFAGVEDSERLRGSGSRARAAAVRFEAVDPTSPAAVWAVGRYFAEIGRRFGFDPSAEPDDGAASLAAPGGCFVLAIGDGAAVACGGVRTIEDGVGEIKRMWVDDAWRGAGLGSRLLLHLEQTAHALGHRTVRLDTHESLTEAIALYEKAGYRPIGRYNDNPHATHFFERVPRPRP
ncbi:GNAT family N-acetyltransferase [Parafrankia sp. EUN1f]|uniref:GNAT family N-acetyltransferase n=1 Tax=Parafrankia sp. EUN1f TaxID=102897 RepID=UPI0001C45DFA|nr:GNAT family N-acetyltransferase [Parafrankia sp. EUN1f]EFC84305.1 GCN5-related N-acetyltransferase [Parafrankia sp. EUN1f]